MKIDTIVNQHRRDFNAIYRCEHCDHVTKPNYGYDDENFHKNVIPQMECPKCHEIAPTNYRPLTPKYPDAAVI